MASRGTTGFFVPTSASATQVEELGVTPTSGYQDLRLRSLGLGSNAPGTAGQAIFANSGTPSVLFGGSSSSQCALRGSGTVLGGVLGDASEFATLACHDFVAAPVAALTSNTPGL